MCHVVDPQRADNSNFGIYNLVLTSSREYFLVGRKSFYKLPDSDCLRGFIRNNYIYKNIKKSEFGLIIKESPVLQEITFNLPITEDYTNNSCGTISAYASLPSGMHIAPLCLATNNNNIGIDVTNLDALVLFKPEAVLFYDSDEVSVKELILPTPKIMRELLENFKVIPHKNYIGMYDEIYYGLRVEEEEQCSM